MIDVTDVINFLGEDATEIADYLLWALDNPREATEEIQRYKDNHDT